MSLNPQQARFVAAYLGEADGNASEAARIAGYKKPGQTGHRLLKHAKISPIIERNRSVVLSSAILSRTEVLEVLSGIVAGEIGETQVPTGLDGMPLINKETKEPVVIQIPPKPSDRTRAAAQMAKMQGWDRKAPIDGAEALRGKHPLEVVALLRAKANEMEAQTLRQMGSGEDE